MTSDNIKMSYRITLTGNKFHFNSLTLVSQRNKSSCVGGKEKETHGLRLSTSYNVMGECSEICNPNKQNHSNVNKFVYYIKSLLLIQGSGKTPQFLIVVALVSCLRMKKKIGTFVYETVFLFLFSTPEETLVKSKIIVK